MAIAVTDFYGIEALHRAVGRVTMLADESVFPYADAEVTYDHFDPAVINFSTFYVLEDHLLEVVDVMTQLALAGHNPFDLKGIVKYTDDAGNVFKMGPILLEATIETLYGKEGASTTAQVINAVDGAHRLIISQLAREHWDSDLRTGTVLVRNASVPTYAVPNERRHVAFVSTVPDPKKLSRDSSNPYLRYRGLSAISSSAPRTVGATGNDGQTAVAATDVVARPGQRLDEAIGKLVGIVHQLQIDERRNRRYDRGFSEMSFASASLDDYYDEVPELRIVSDFAELGDFTGIDAVVVHATTNLTLDVFGVVDDAPSVSTENVPEGFFLARNEMTVDNNRRTAHIYLTDADTDGVARGSAQLRLPAGLLTTVLIDRPTSPYFFHGATTVGGFQNCNVISETGADVNASINGSVTVVDSLADTSSAVCRASGRLHRLSVRQLSPRAGRRLELSGGAEIIEPFQPRRLDMARLRLPLVDKVPTPPTFLVVGDSGTGKTEAVSHMRTHVLEHHQRRNSYRFTDFDALLAAGKAGHPNVDVHPDGKGFDLHDTDGSAYRIALADIERQVDAVRNVDPDAVIFVDIAPPGRYEQLLPTLSSGFLDGAQVLHVTADEATCLDRINRRASGGTTDDHVFPAELWRAQFGDPANTDFMAEWQRAPRVGDQMVVRLHNADANPTTVPTLNSLVDAAISTATARSARATLTTGRTGGVGMTLPSAAAAK